MHHAPGSDSPPTDATSTADPHLELTREVSAGASDMRDVRAELRKHFERWGLGEWVANAVLDTAHELVVNGHQHGRPPVRLTVRVDVDEVRVEVYDSSPSPARLLPYRPGVSEHGLGLQLVRQLSSQWGQTMDMPETDGEEAGGQPGGKSVWAVFARRRGTSG